MISYLDTNVALWLAQGQLDRISALAKKHVEQSSLLISPMVLLEMEYLYEIKRIVIPARDIHLKLKTEIAVRACDLPFPDIAEKALDEKWTRDPFDRMIVAHAKASGFSYLISSDIDIQKHYPRTIW